MGRDDGGVCERERGKHLDTMYFFYTTCPKCAQHYKNYVVGVAKVSPFEG